MEYNWKIRVSMICDDERKMIVTYISAYGMQRQSHKGKLSSNEVFEWPSLHIEHTITTQQNNTNADFPVAS